MSYNNCNGLIQLAVVFFCINCISSKFLSFEEQINLEAQNLVGGADFSSIDGIVARYITNHSFPGCTISVRNGTSILFEKAYGFQEYPGDKLGSVPTTLDSIFDMASVTKVLATTTTIMHLYQKQLIGLDDTVVTYLPDYGKNNKSAITIRNLLLHNSGMQADGPFVNNPGYNEQSILQYIYNDQLYYPTGSMYLYSDFSFILLGKIAQKVMNQSLATIADELTFKPLEMQDTMFTPPADPYLPRIHPTEYDKLMRQKLCHGFVHDETCYLMGKVAGHAGLFSTAPDAQQIMTMLLNEGSYLNSTGYVVQIFKPETVSLFTTRVTDLSYNNSRTLGWDSRPSGVSPCGVKFSVNSFGHTGFTGTTVWADKDNYLSIVILTNRVYPDRIPTAEAIKYFRNQTYTEICNIIGIK